MRGHWCWPPSLPKEVAWTPRVVADACVKSARPGTLCVARPQSSCQDPTPCASLAPRPGLMAPHRLLLVLKDFAGLLERAGLLPALSLQVPLLHLLQERVGPAGSLQDTVGLVPGQEHWAGGQGSHGLATWPRTASRERERWVGQMVPGAAPAGARPPRAEPAPSWNSALLEALGPAPPGPLRRSVLGSAVPSARAPRPVLCARWGLATWFCTVCH